MARKGGHERAEIVRDYCDVQSVREHTVVKVRCFFELLSCSYRDVSHLAVDMRADGAGCPLAS